MYKQYVVVVVVRGERRTFSRIRGIRDVGWVLRGFAGRGNCKHALTLRLESHLPVSPSPVFPSSRPTHTLLRTQHHTPLPTHQHHTPTGLLQQ